MPYLQIILILLGSTASGICGGFLLAFGVCLLFPSTPDGWGAAYLIFFLVIIGSIVGALVGFFRGYRWVTQRGISPWKPITWIGMLAGMVLGLGVHFFGPSFIRDLTLVWWINLIPVIAFGMLGAVICTKFSPYFTSIEKLTPQPARRKRKKKKRKAPGPSSIP
ncbi:MAG TPA: hypothetical protein PLN21_22480 [Gemmatales bacterium]|nr:hypothetical protein [Gemmatales bacterium]